MAVSKSQQKAVHKYVKANYDRLELTVPKGRKDEIKAHAEAQGQSVNGFINAAIDEKMEKPSQRPVDGPNLNEGAEMVYLPSDTLQAAQEAAEAAGEAVPQFIGRAVTTQAQEDTRIRLNAERQAQTAAALVGEIEDTARLVTSTLWCNVFYNGKLYKKPGDAQKVHDALVECKRNISTTLDNLADGIHLATGKQSRKGTAQNGGEAGNTQ